MAYLIGRPLHGATQQQVADMLEVSLQTANRFMQHLVGKGRIHIAIKAQALGRNSPAVYKYGPPTVTVIPKWCIYKDLPLAFFRSSGSKPKRKRKVNTTKMTDWCEIKDQDPPKNGAWECKMVGSLAEKNADGTDKTHKRWFDNGSWSWPLQPEHEREDGFVKPHEDYFIDPDLTPNFAWRGFTDDQEPL